MSDRDGQMGKGAREGDGMSFKAGTTGTGSQPATERQHLRRMQVNPINIITNIKQYKTLDTLHFITKRVVYFMTRHTLAIIY